MSERLFKKPSGLEGRLEFIRPSKLAEEGITGVILEGEYLGGIPNQFNEAVLDYKFRTDDGTLKVINSTGSLAYQMSVIKPGDIVQINYLGKETIQTGKMAGKQAHQFEVLVA